MYTAYVEHALNNLPFRTFRESESNTLAVRLHNRKFVFARE